MRGIDNQNIDPCFDERTHTILALGAGTDCRGGQQALSRIFCRIRMTLCLDHVFNGHQTL